MTVESSRLASCILPLELCALSAKICEMDLKTALQLRSCELVAFVGAGGKTTAAWLLLRQVVASGERAVFTTTTHIFEPKKAPLLLDANPDPADVVRMLIEVPAIVLAARRAETDTSGRATSSPYPALSTKLKGLDPQTLTELSRRLPGITWIVEADGAKGRQLKVPAEHEPAIPAGADHVIIVAGLGALNRPLDESTVHRPELAARLLSLPVGTMITATMVARLIDHPSGGLKNVPPHAAPVVLLVQRGARVHPQAEKIASRLLLGGHIHRVVLANLRAPVPVLGVWG